MKKRTLLFISIFFAVAFISCTSENSINANFEYFRYKGNDAFFDKPYDPAKQFINPVVAGFYPDPSICKKGDTYYMVHSSFSLYPGVPIFKSTDLVNWQQIGHVLDRPSQLNLDGLRISSGIFAPAIEYNPHNDTFYMITTCTWGIGNFYVKTNDPEQGWGEPILLPQVKGIDPSLFFDDDGKGYVIECAEPLGSADWRGQRGIHLHELDVESDKLTGRVVEIVRGGTNIEKKPVWIEAPHIYKINNLYYLMCAEGGTGLNHSEVIFRGKSPWGPYEEYEHNPILTQRDLPEERPYKITTAGHADMIETANGEWWAVFLGVRPYDFDMFNTGREVFLLPVEWTNDGWPVILPKGEAIPIVVDKNDLQPNENIPPTTGNFEFIDQFTSTTLDYTWKLIRTPRDDFFSVGNGMLELIPRSVSIEEMLNPSVLLRSQQHTTFEAETKLEFTPVSNTDFAGFTLFQNEEHHFVFGKTLIDGTESLIINRIEKGKETLAVLALSRREAAKPIYLKVAGNGADYDFMYSLNGKEWNTLLAQADGTNLSTRKAGGFIGALIGLYATTNF
jgi:xylan 1,4-beta-xylosidase